MNAKTILLRRQNKLLVEKSTNSADNTVLVTLLRNIEPLGYILAPEVIEVLQTYSMDELTDFYKDLVKNLKKMTGANKKWEPMYPNFPTQVAEASDCELFMNAVLHYFGQYYLDLRIMPEYEKDERLPLLDITKLKVIKLGTDKDVVKMFQNLMASNTSISMTDKQDMAWAIEHLSFEIPQIVHKEILGFVYSRILLKGSNIDLAEVAHNFKTATDVLRLAVALSEGDVSLAKPTKFRNFSRKERRFFLGLLENCTTDITEDMLRYKNVWIKLGEKLHPGDYKSVNPKTYTAFDILRNNKAYSTFNSQVEELLLTHDVKGASVLLQKRPGDFARRLDHLLRYATRYTEVTTPFAKVADKVSSPVLLQVMTHFSQRHEKKDLRVFIPKGNVSKVQAVKNELPTLSLTACTRITTVCKEALQKRYGKLDKLGKVFVDSALVDYTVPFSQRSASESLRTLSRGSRVALPEGNTLRFFLWWKDIKNGGTSEYDRTVDIDLSAVLYNKDWGKIDHISYTNLRSKTNRAYHSGDIVSAPRGACEFIDIDINSFLEGDGRYVIMNVLSYTGQPFSDIEECFCGWMMRQKPNSGEIFEAKTVQDKLDLNSNSKVNVPVIFDLVERKMIFVDLALSERCMYGGNNIESNLDTIGMMGKSLQDFKKPNLFDLFMLHAESRGELVDNVEDADVVFSVEETLENGISPYDYEKIVGEFI